MNQEYEKASELKAKKEEVLNRDLWEELAGVVSDIQLSGTTIAWNYTPGHAGIPGNDRADEIATTFADGKPTKLFDGARSLYSVDLGIHTGDAKKIAAKKSKPKTNVVKEICDELKITQKQLTKAAISYIQMGENSGVVEGYKCKIRMPLWWNVPSSWRPDAFLLR